MRFFKRRSTPVEPEPFIERRSAIQIYLEGGGDPTNVRTMEILAEADRSRERAPVDAPCVGEYLRAEGEAEPGPLHAHEISPDDAAMLRMLAGANFGPDASVTLPSGRTVTGAEMRRWVEAADQPNEDRP